MKALIIGMAKSGVASAELLAKQGYEVIINDRKKEEDFKGELNCLKELGLEWRLGEDPVALLSGVDLLVLSPAVPIGCAAANKAREMGIEVIGEIELGYRYSKADFVAITGTNGKTTTTALTGQVFSDGGFHTFTVGNIGLPIAQKALETVTGDIMVAEVAGFQLESTKNFHPKVCAFLNMTEDHLDRFGTMEAYIASKLHIFKNQTPNDFAILNYDDKIVRNFNQKTKAKVLYFSRLQEVENGIFVRDGKIIFRMDGRETAVCDAGEVRIRGAHNLENAMAAVGAGMCMGIPAQSIRKTLMEFPGVEHRIEFVREWNGVRFFNDSKATNPDSTIKAVEAMDRPTILMLGGYEKKSDFMPLFEAFNEYIKGIVALGFTKQRIVDTAKRAGFENIRVADTFEEAIEKAYEMAGGGYNVLFSPASASYDMFDNFEQRGEVFKQIVNSMGR